MKKTVKFILIFFILTIGFFLTSCGKDLPIPNNVRLEGDMLKWDNSGKKYTYIVAIENNTYETKNTYYNVKDLDLSPGDYLIRVASKNKKKTSKFSTYELYHVPLTSINAPSVVITNNKNISWEEVLYSDHYEVCINDYCFINKDNNFNITNLEILNQDTKDKYNICLYPGKYVIKVRSINEDNNLYSNYSKSQNIIVSGSNFNFKNFYIDYIKEALDITNSPNNLDTLLLLNEDQIEERIVSFLSDIDENFEILNFLDLLITFTFEFSEKYSINNLIKQDIYLFLIDNFISLYKEIKTNDNLEDLSFLNELVSEFINNLLNYNENFVNEFIGFVVELVDYFSIKFESIVTSQNLVDLDSDFQTLIDFYNLEEYHKSLSTLIYLGSNIINNSYDNKTQLKESLQQVVVFSGHVYSYLTSKSFYTFISELFNEKQDGGGGLHLSDINTIKDEMFENIKSNMPNEDSKAFLKGVIDNISSQLDDLNFRVVSEYFNLDDNSFMIVDIDNLIEEIGILFEFDNLILSEVFIRDFFNSWNEFMTNPINNEIDKIKLFVFNKLSEMIENIDYVSQDEALINYLYTLLIDEEEKLDEDEMLLFGLKLLFFIFNNTFIYEN